MDNRYFKTATMAGLGMIVAGSVPLLGEFTGNIKIFIFSIAICIAMLPFAIWGIIKLAKKEKNGKDSDIMF